MSTKKNIAAKGAAASLPTLGQIQFLACKLMEVNLGQAINFACEAGIWKEEYQRPINVAELALECVRGLRARTPLDIDEFIGNYTRIQSTIAAACTTFPDKDTGAWRLLHAAETGFTEFDEALELAEAAERATK
ncbi:MAG: hypothetical protein ACN6OP_12835 [Pseudomonadales bacterium]